MLTLQKVSLNFQISHYRIVQLLRSHGFKIERRPDQEITDQQLAIIKKEVKIPRPNNVKAVQKQNAGKRPYSSPPAARQKIEDWFYSRSKVPVAELARKIGTHVDMLLFELNKEHEIKYTENSIIDYDRFFACMSFIAARFYLSRQQDFFNPPKKKPVKRQAKKQAKNKLVVKAEKDTPLPKKKKPKNKVKDMKERVGFLAEPAMEPHIKWPRIRLIGHPKQ